MAGGLKKPPGTTAGWPAVPACRMDVGGWEGESHDGRVVAHSWPGRAGNEVCWAEKGLWQLQSKSSSSSNINRDRDISAQSPGF